MIPNLTPIKFVNGLIPPTEEPAEEPGSLWFDTTLNVSDGTNWQNLLTKQVADTLYTNNLGTVTSVSIGVPAGLVVNSGAPLTAAGSINIGLEAGYSIPTVANQATWSAKQDFLNGTGLVKSSGGTITYITDNSATWNAKQAAINFSTTGSSGPATFDGVNLNIPNYAGGGSTDLALGTATTTTQPITNSNGTGFILPSAVAGSAAGLLSAADKTKLDAITGTNTGDQTTITGNAGTATALQTSRTIFGQSFNGTANVSGAATVTTLTMSGALTGGTTAAFSGAIACTSVGGSNTLKGQIIFNTTGLNITRNDPDANTLVNINQLHSSSTGLLQSWQFVSSTVASLDKTGVFRGAALQNLTASTNSNIAVGTTGTVITRNVADANAALIVNNVAGTFNIAEFQQAGTTVARVYLDGRIGTAGIFNYTNSINSIVYTKTTGAEITRNVADANPALIVNNILGTSNIQVWQQGSADVAALLSDGRFRGLGLSNMTNVSNVHIQTLTTGAVITRNIADANTVLIVNQVHASSTGAIFQAQFGGTNRFAISAAGALTLGVVPTTSAGTYDILTRNTSTGVIEKIASSIYAKIAGGNTFTEDQTINGGVLYVNESGGLGGVVKVQKVIQVTTGSTSTDYTLPSGSGISIYEKNNRLTFTQSTSGNSIGLDISGLAGTKVATFQNADGTLAYTVQNVDYEVTQIGKGLILKSPDGTRYRVTVPNGGASLTITAI